MQPTTKREQATVTIHPRDHELTEDEQIFFDPPALLKSFDVGTTLIAPILEVRLEDTIAMKSAPFVPLWNHPFWVRFPAFEGAAFYDKQIRVKEFSCVINPVGNKAVVSLLLRMDPWSMGYPETDAKRISPKIANTYMYMGYTIVPLHMPLNKEELEKCNITMPAHSMYVMDTNDSREKIRILLTTEFMRCLCMLSEVYQILSCKNVGLTEISPALPKNKSKRKRMLKDTPYAFNSYHILDIPGEGDYTAGTSGGGGTLRNHIVRGHYKTYTAEAPLFGRCVGTYWVSSFTRGNKDKGTVTKDYRIKEKP